MKWVNRVAVVGAVVGAVAAVVMYVEGLTQQVPLLTTAAVALFVLNAWNGKRCWRMEREHRRAARDSDNPDTAGIAFGTAAGDITFGTTNTSAGSGLKETDAEVPILAFKTYQLGWSPPGKFSFVGYGGAVPSEDDAQCRRDPYMLSLMATFGSKPPPHSAECPDIACSCGYYAMKREEDIRGSIGVEVELSGRVIVCETGYRAQHQRILRAHVGGCTYCGKPCTVVGLHQDNGGVTPLCDACSVQSSLSALVVVPVDVVEQSLGIPVEWAAKQ